jgi:hypothetical protein
MLAPIILSRLRTSDKQGALLHVTLSVQKGTLSFISDWDSLFNMPFSGALSEEI